MKKVGKGEEDKRRSVINFKGLPFITISFN